MEPIRHHQNPNFGGVIFRRTTPEIRNEGGLWDASEKIYPYLNASPTKTVLEWNFESGAKLKFSHLEHEKDKISWQGSEIPFIGFDELTHFTKSQFFYLLSRNRSTSGVSPYVRATCNPDPDSWVYELIKWWIDDDTGYPIPERDGVIRYFVTHQDKYIWGDSKKEVIDKASFFIAEMVQASKGLVKPEDFIKSITFISGSIYDNKELLRKNPEYLANLNAQDEDTKKRLLDGNWKVKKDAKDVYQYHAFLDAFTNTHVPDGKPYITSDIAMDGVDKFIIWVWRGFRIVDVCVLDKSDGPLILDRLKHYKDKWKVPERNISYDSGGVGRFIKGFMRNAFHFLSNSRPFKKENYEHLKAQCYYKSGERVSSNDIYITPEVADARFSKDQTIKDRLLQERKSIKKIDSDDRKQKINPKKEQKVLNNGDSPDLLDAFSQREVFGYVKKEPFTVTVSG